MSGRDPRYPSQRSVGQCERFDPGLLVARHQFYERAWPTPAYIAYVRRHVLDVGLISDFVGGTAVMSVVDCGNGRFDWDATGSRYDAFVCEAYDVDGETTIDIVAWPVDGPGHVLTMFGRAPLLGLWHALNPATYTLGKALVMHRTPLDWLKAGCAGAAVVTPRLAARQLMDIPGPIAARDRAHARELLRMAHSVVDDEQIVVAAADNARAA
ncbi:hypothetical protein EMQ25_17205 [Arsenicitalea aurantiaca]|uniref:Uncharacterized protein n=1 Tax=Arsenicitalea aurantiaca TaxID=1783274 RepID=A0A433X2L0_9HYPH|nr:hypothetical protein [Arsenicitalea aurantiaca]RUT28323.1 hypothetical protein EMQ25_17205 [Arsenicitalea aurantiaca]